MTRWTFAAVGPLVAALLLAGGTLSPASATDGDPLAGAAVVGECRHYTAAERAEQAEDSSPVDCGSRHTAEVIAVEQAPRTYEMEGEASLRLTRFANNVCDSAFRRTLRIRHEETHVVAYTYSWFLPTRAQLALGARWVRCDVNLLDGPRLGVLPRRTPEVGYYDIDKSERRCLTRAYLVVACTEAHAWFSRGVATVPDGRYSTDRIDAAARRRCPSVLHRDDRRYLWIRPTEFGWTGGERHVTCYAQD